MHTLAILNQKGGVGKTTTAVTLAHGLALDGFTTLLVDLDAQGNCADALGIEKSNSLHRLLINDEGKCIDYARDSLDIIVSDKSTSAAKQIMAGMPFREKLLQKALSQFDYVYDYAVLDAAPGVDVLQVAALVACDAFLIPVTLDHLAVIGAADALASAMSLSQLGALDARFLGILPTMWERTTNESHAQLQALAGQFGQLVWPPIPLDVKARECTAHGQTLWEYSPDTRAIKGVRIHNGTVIGGYEAVKERLVGEIG